MAESKLRCFISITLPATVKSALTATQQRLKSAGLKAAWTKSTQFHLTLSFLGDQPFTDLSAIQSAMAGAAKGRPAFNLNLTRPGAFPSLKKPRVLWMGLGGDVDALKKLCRDLMSELHGAGLNFKKQKFSPHITIGRVKGAGAGAILSNLPSENPALADVGWAVEEIHLFESRLNPTGAVHTRLFSVNLAGS